jgi:hypothetical protein
VLSKTHDGEAGTETCERKTSQAFATDIDRQKVQVTGK